MTSKMPAGTYSVRATNPKLNPPIVVESCPTSAAMEIRAGQLYLAGYDVEVIHSRLQEDKET